MNMKTENYAIIRLRSWYGANDTSSVYATSEASCYSGDLEDYDQLTLDEAREIVESEDGDTYYLAHNEAGRAELLIVPESIIRQIIDIQHDCSGADWADYDGADDDEQAVNQYIADQILAIARAGEVQA